MQITKQDGRMIQIKRKQIEDIRVRKSINTSGFTVSMIAKQAIFILGRYAQEKDAKQAKNDLAMAVIRKRDFVTPKNQNAAEIKPKQICQ